MKAAIAIAALAGPAFIGAAAASPVAEEAAVARVCRVTVPESPPPVPGAPGFTFGNRRLAVILVPTGRLVAGRLPGGGKRATINADGSISAKFGWWVVRPGRLRITGRRSDGMGPALKSHVPDGYGARQATGLTFPLTGCWRVTGAVGSTRITFTLLVTKSPLGP